MGVKKKRSRWFRRRQSVRR